MAYLTAEKLMRFLGRETYLSLHDDGGDRDLENADFLLNVADTIASAEAATTAWFPDSYSGALPFAEPVPAMVELLAKYYGRAFAWQRNVDYMLLLQQGKGINWLKLADDLGEKIQRSTLRMVDAPAPVPTNVGGDVSSMDEDSDFMPRKPFFLGGMGDY